jgi:CO dehydrogenase/acetyl-CoA synthase epsilon subunit
MFLIILFVIHFTENAWGNDNASRTGENNVGYTFTSPVYTVEEKNNIKADVLQGIISKGKNSILFIGYGLEGEDLKEKLLATFKSIDIQQ